MRTDVDKYGAISFEESEDDSHVVLNRKTPKVFQATGEFVSSEALIEGIVLEYFQAFPEARFQKGVAFGFSLKGALE